MMLFFCDSPRVPCRPCSIKMAILQKIYIVALYIVALYIDVYFVYLSYLLIELQIVSSPFQY